MTETSTIGCSIDLPCRVCVFFDPFGLGLPAVEREGKEPYFLDPNFVSSGWGFSTERDAVGNPRPPFFAPAPAAGRSPVLDLEGTKAFFEKVWREHGRDGRVVGVLEGGKLVVAAGELLLVVPSWCVVLRELSAVSGQRSAVSHQPSAVSGQSSAEGPMREIVDDPYARAAALEISCPYPACRATEGQPCKNPQTGAVRSEPHPTRVFSAKTTAVEAEVQDDADAEGEILDPDRTLSLSPKDVLTVACPRKRCGAKPGESCVSVQGHSRHAHPGRWRVAMLRMKERRAVEVFSRELTGHVMNEGRKAASQGRARSENPHQLESPQEVARRTAWDAGWIYVAGSDRLRQAVEDEKRGLRGASPVDSSAGYSIERHGPEGQYALYFGRGTASHGLNLCALTDFDDGARGEVVREDIIDALEGKKTVSRMGPYKLVSISDPGKFALFREGPPLDRLCTLWDFDKDGSETRRRLLEGLNRGSLFPVYRPQTLDPLSIDCPLAACGAKAGEPCRKLAGDGGPRTEPHPARADAAERETTGDRT